MNLLSTVERETGRAYEIVVVPATEADAKYARPLPDGGFFWYNLVKRYV